MIITVSEKEFTTIEETINRIGLEGVKLQEEFGHITEEEKLFYVDSLKLPKGLSEEKIKEINETYGVIIKVRTSWEGYTIWINPDFVADYVNLYSDFTVGLIGLMADVYKKVKFLVNPLIEKFVSKWDIL